MTIIRNLQKKLDSILIKLQDDDHMTFGPIITLMKFIGVWHPRRSKAKALFFYSHFAFSLLFTANIVTYACAAAEYRVIINLLQFFVLSFASLKTCFYLIDHKNWEAFYFGVLDVEKKSIATEGEHKEIILKYRKYTHYLIVCYWSFETIVVVTYYICFCLNNVIIPFAYNDIDKTDYIVLYDTWSPFDEGTLSGRIITGVVKIFFTSIGCFYIYYWDVTIVATMCFLAAQLKALRVRCVHALDDPQEDICINNIAECHQHYLELLKYSSMLNDLIAIPIFLYMVYISIETGVNIVMTVMNVGAVTELINATAITIGMMMHIFVTFWLANEVIVQSNNLAYGIFESKWVGASKRVRRDVMMLGIGMRKRIAFTIGPFKEMSLDTYISLVKFSYSFYTLLRQRNQRSTNAI